MYHAILCVLSIPINFREVEGYALINTSTGNHMGLDTVFGVS